MENERVICCDRGNNDNALAAAILAGNRRDDSSALAASILASRNNDDNAMWPMMAMCSGGMGGQWLVYMVLMMMMRNGMWGNNGQNAQNIELQNQIQAMRTQLSDGQNAQLLRDAIGDGFNRNDFALSQLSQNLNVDFNALQKVCCDVQAAIQNVAGKIDYSAERVINAANLGDKDIITALKDCCCNVRESIADMYRGIELQQCKDTGAILGGQRDVKAAVTEAIAKLGYDQKQDKCDIINAIHADKQAIIDTLKDHWNQEQSQKIQDLKNEVLTLKQNNLIIARTGGYNNGCCNGNQYNEGF